MMFIVDNPKFEQLGAEFMEIQKKGNIVFPNQLSKFHDAIYELVFDKFFNSLTDAHNIVMNNTNFDFTNVFDRQDFATAFPQFAIRIQSNANIDEFWKSILSFEEYSNLSDDTKDRLANNVFIKSLIVSGLTRNKLMTSVNTKDMVSTELARYKDAFNDLPETIKNMFTYYELIENKMNFRKGSIMHIIGTDFYKGTLSDVFNQVYNDLFEVGLSTFTGSPDTIDVLKDKFFDYLGMNEGFSPNVSIGSFDVVNGPKYIWNYGEERKLHNGTVIRGKRVNFFKKENGEYKPINRNTWKSTISMSKDTNSQYKTFVRGIKELSDYKINESKGRVTTHIGHTDFVKGDILVSEIIS